MSGDVQPRKRKDKKRKKDELTLEEPRGTAAALGEGDVFMHSYQDHGTGGHWCAKIIFFSLLAVLVTLIGLIILENRGLSELEANAVESRYSGVLDGWLEDAPDDDHHDEHTLELTHHDDDEDEHDTNDVYRHDEDDESHEDEGFGDGHDDEDDDDGDEQGDDDKEDEQEKLQTDADDEDDDDSVAADEDEDYRSSYRKYFRDDDDEGDDEDDEQDEQDDQQDEKNDEWVKRYSYDLIDDEDDDDNKREKQSIFDVDDDEEAVDDTEKSYFYNQDDDEGDDTNEEDNGANYEDDDDGENNSNENEDYSHNYQDQQLSEEDLNTIDENYDENDSQSNNKDDDEHDGHDEEDDAHDEEIEVEKIEREPDDEEPISLELPALPEADDDDDDDNEQDDGNDENAKDDDKSDEFLDPEDDDLPVVERITVPSGKPFVEVEDTDVSTELPPDTLEEEEEYEKKQEELRKAEEESTNMWLKLSIGAALLAATHVVMRRATTTRDDADEDISREHTPVTDRRMTLIPEEVETVTPKKVQEISKPVVENIVKKIAPEVKAAPKLPIEEDEDIEEIEEIEIDEEYEEVAEKNKELYSDEEVEEEEKVLIEQKVKPKAVVKEPTPELEEDDDDVEIIDEQVEEEIIEEEEEISDVDDSELLTRLEAKYGRLPEPDLPKPKHKDGGNSVDDDWPGEPAHAYWQQQLDEAEKELRQGLWSAAAARAQKEALKDSARARWILARALDEGAERQRDNAMLSRAIAAYLNVLKMHESLPDNKLKKIAQRTLDRMMFRGNYVGTEPVYRLMMRRFPQDPSYRNNLSIACLMSNRNDMAEEVLKGTLKLWPKDSVALAHYAFVLKNQHNRLEEAVDLFQLALKGDEGPACEPRFYYHLGDALLLLGRFAEANEVHKRGAKFGHFLSPVQRSLYNVKRLKGQPWWNVEQTPYDRLAQALEKSWKDILKEGLAAHALYEQEKEGLKERGQWSQLDLFARGHEIPDRCKKAPITCSIVKTEPAAVGCRRGQIKFSAMEAGTHVRPHVGPTNCRLRMHLALSNTKETYLRVDQETRQWQVGKVLMFDDSFEHEVWHNGTGKRLVLIVDVWHPDLTPLERRQLSPI